MRFVNWMTSLVRTAKKLQSMLASRLLDGAMQRGFRFFIAHFCSRASICIGVGGILLILYPTSKPCRKGNAFWFFLLLFQLNIDQSSQIWLYGVKIVSFVVFLGCHWCRNLNWVLGFGLMGGIWSFEKWWVSRECHVCNFCSKYWFWFNGLEAWNPG